MVVTPSILVFLVLSLVRSGVSYSSEFSQLHSEYPYTQLLDFDGTVEFKWKFDKDTITFQITAPTAGWVGVGFSPSGSMKDADILFGWIKSGIPRILDMHATTNGLPLVDESHDILSSEIRENGTHTVMHVHRWLETCDGEHDFRITESTTRVIFAYGESDPDGDIPTSADYHGTSSRGVKSLRLLDKRLPSLVNGDHIKKHDVITQPFVIPKKDTYYHCFYHKLPELDKKHHIVEFRPVLTPGNAKNIHHITVFHCKESLVTEEMFNRSEECYTNDDGDHWKYCAPVVVSWSVGMTSFTLPEHVGFPIGVPGSAKVVKMEVHYDNAELEEGKVDASGIRILYTAKLRKYDAGILLTGHDVWPSLFIPPGSKDFIVEGHCSAQCLSKVMSDSGVTELKAFGAFLHSHTAGSGMILRHIRNGTELHPIARDLSYDFDYQESKLLPSELRIENGDNLIMECLYNTRKRKVPTMGGLKTRDEMCFGFVMYYPKIEDAYCQSSQSTRRMYANLGAKNIREAYRNAMTKNWTDEKRAEFNQKQLSGPAYEMCITLAGKVQGLKRVYEIPKIKALFVEAPGRCALLKKSHDLPMFQNITLDKEVYIRIEHRDRTSPTVVIVVSTVTAALIFIILGMIYLRLR